MSNLYGNKNGELYDYYMNDAFLIKKKKAKEIFMNITMKQMKFGIFCKVEFASIFQNCKRYKRNSNEKWSEIVHHITVKNEKSLYAVNKKYIQKNAKGAKNGTKSFGGV